MLASKHPFPPILIKITMLCCTSTENKLSIHNFYYCYTTIVHDKLIVFLGCLVLLFNTPDNNLSVISGHSPLLGYFTATLCTFMRLAYGHNKAAAGTSVFSQTLFH